MENDVVVELTAGVPVPTCAGIYKLAGPYVVVRCTQAGVYFGKFVRQVGQTVELDLARLMWGWEGSRNTADLAVYGVKKDSIHNKVSPTVSRVILTEACAVLFCSEVAIKSISAIPEWAVDEVVAENICAE